MRLANRHCMRLAAILALSAASTSVFAQSAEYRRGYEDGYAAGVRAARDDRGRHGGGDRLYVEQADYGARGALCDARRAVRQEADRNGGAVVSGNHLCGDPLPRVEKRLNVIYRCGDGPSQRASAREGDTLHLGCRR